MGNFIDLTGQKFGRLTVIEKNGHKGEKIAWLCKCDCGNYVTVTGTGLKSGNTKSCGCLKKEIVSKIKTKHGDANTRLYQAWQNMKNRVNNPNQTEYKNYGGRGIKICAEWYSYENFRDWSLSNGYDDTLTLDRINVNGNYSPENCRWVGKIVQANNKTNNHFLTYNGKTQTLTQWEKETGIRRQTIDDRIKSGWSVKDALNTPVEKHLSRLLTYNGKTQTLAQWSRETGIKRTTISRRIDTYAWSVEKALTTHVTKRKDVKQ